MIRTSPGYWQRIDIPDELPFQLAWTVARLSSTTGAHYERQVAKLDATLRATLEKYLTTWRTNSIENKQRARSVPAGWPYTHFWSTSNCVLHRATILARTLLWQAVGAGPQP